MTDPTAPVEDMGEFLRLQLENSRLRLELAMAQGIEQPEPDDGDTPA